jgi:hypothetical protein
MKTMIAKFPGKCKKTGARILTGDLIQWSKAGAVLITGDDLIAARKAPRVNLITLIGEQGAKTFYRNAGGRCIDAPCCGCCTI